MRCSHGSCSLESRLIGRAPIPRRIPMEERMRRGFMAAPQTPESGHGMARVTTSDPTLRGIDLGASMLKHWMSYGLVLVAGMAMAVGCEGDGGTLPAAPAFVTVDFSTCDVADRAAWLAYQVGYGEWTNVKGRVNVYTYIVS